MTHPTTHVNEWNRKTVQTIKTAQTIYTYIKSAIEIKEPSKSSSSFANCMGIIEAATIEQIQVFQWLL